MRPGRLRDATRLVARTLLAAVLLGVPPATASTTVPLSFAQLVHDAGCVVHGTVAGVVSERDGHGIPSTWVTLDVAHVVKAPATARLTFKQFGTSGSLPDGTAHPSGLPAYAVGDEVVLFLYHESDHGFTSPLAGAQGYYRVERRDGRAVVRGGAGGGRSLEGFLADVARLAGTP